MLKQKRGITLVALVVTIIILLILAGVSISMIFGEEGIFSKTQIAAEKYKQAQEDEQAMLNEVQNYINGNYEIGNARGNIEFLDKYDLWTNWLLKAGINPKDYNSSDILNNEVLLTKLMNNKEAVAYLKNSTDFIIPAIANSEAAMTKLGASTNLGEMLKSSQAISILRNSSYKNKIEENLIKSDNAMTSAENNNAKVTESNYDTNEGGYYGYHAFDGTWTWQNSWISAPEEPVTSTEHPSLIYQFKNNSIVPYKFVIMGNSTTDYSATGKAYIEASKTGEDNTYKIITSEFDLPPTQTITVYPNQNLDDYSYFKLTVTKETGTYGWKKAIISEWEIYGK